MSNVSPTKIDPNEFRWATVSNNLKNSIEQIQQRWNVRSATLFLAADLDYGQFHSDVEEFYMEGPARGLGVFASLKDGSKLVGMLSSLLALVGPGGNELRGVVMLDDYNHHIVNL